MNTFQFFISNEEKPDAKDRRNRLSTYAKYLETRDLRWYLPDLDDYKAYLEKEVAYAPGTVMTHLRAVKRWYKNFLKRLSGTDQTLMDRLMQTQMDVTSAEIDKAEHLMKEAARYETVKAKVEAEEVFRYPSDDYLQAQFSIDLKSLQDMRDLVILGFAFCAGLSEPEIIALNHEHVHCIEGRAFQIRVPAVIVKEERVIEPFDDQLFRQPWLKQAMSAWLKHAPTQEGALFGGFFRGGNTPRSSRITGAGVKLLVQIHSDRARETLEKEEPKITILDLRRAAARRLYLNDVEFKDIKALLGFNTTDATLKYIGPPISREESIPKALDADSILEELARIESQSRDRWIW